MSIHLDFVLKVNWFGEIFTFFAVNKAVLLNQHGTCYVIGEQCQFTTPMLMLSQLLQQPWKTELGSTNLCTLEAPSTLLPMLRKKGPGIGGELRTNPVFRVGRKTPALEMSMLNAGAMFDVELPIVWNTLTCQVTESDALWVYILD